MPAWTVPNSQYKYKKEQYVANVTLVEPLQQSGPHGSLKYVPGEADIWVFVLFEALVFSSYFIVYLIKRVQNSELYLHSQEHLSQGLGIANTLVLLISSLFMAQGVRAARERRYGVALRQVTITIFCGVLFLCSKLFEWAIEIRRGFEFSTNEFFSFYYFLTGIHVLHVVFGFVFLGVVIYQLSNPLRRSQVIIETGATYWHMVDFLWVFIFALLYVMR
jgi:nitric oxide reductase NorE protein